MDRIFDEVKIFDEKSVHIWNGKFATFEFKSIQILYFFLEFRYWNKVYACSNMTLMNPHAAKILEF